MNDGSIDFEMTPDLDSRVRDAEARIKALTRDYEIWASEDLNDAKQALEVARALPDGRQTQIKKIFGVTHNMKGQGGTFGYELITMIGHSLCNFIRHIPDATDSELKVIDHHLAAMEMVLGNKVKGPGGAFAEKISAKLEHVITVCRG